MTDQRAVETHNKSSFLMTCGGCDRKFTSVANFEHHFWCPWRGSDSLRIKINPRPLPLFHFKSEKFFYPDDVSQILDEYIQICRKELWNKLTNQLFGLDNVVLLNIYYFSSSEVRNDMVERGLVPHHIEFLRC